MSLFDDVERTDLDDALWGEPHFSYLNRSARHTFATIRATLDEWFSHVPDERQKDLRQRFRSMNNHQHDSAFFELVLHEMLLRLGCTVSWEPSVSGRPTRPDFLVQAPGGERFYLEAAVITGKSREEAAAEARMNEVYDAINRLDSPNFFIGVRIAGVPRSPVPAKRLRGFLAAHLAELDPDDITRRFDREGLAGVPTWRFEWDGWVLQFFPIPKRPEARGRAGVRPLGFLQTDPRLDLTAEHMRAAVLDKAGRYGQLDLPYIVAVNVLTPFREDDVYDALFGDRVPELDIASGAIRPKRKPNGVWTAPGGPPRFTRVSAVLIAQNLHPYKTARGDLAVWHNPWASRPATGLLPSLTHYVRINGRMQRRDGRPLGDVLCLPDGWPGEDD